MRIFISLLMVSFLPFAGLEAEAAVIRAAKGRVAVKRQKKYVALKNGMKVARGEVVHTGADSLAVIQLETGDVLKLDAESSVRVDAEKTGDSPQASASLFRGAAFSRIQRKAARGAEKSANPLRFRLRTRTATMGVRGTTFYTSYGTEEKKKDLWMCVNEGSVEVTVNESRKKQVVKEGQGILLPGGSKLTSPKEYAWTKRLNWNTDPESGNLVNSADFSSAYDDLLDVDYD